MGGTTLYRLGEIMAHMTQRAEGGVERLLSDHLEEAPFDRIHGTSYRKYRNCATGTISSLLQENVLDLQGRQLRLGRLTPMDMK
jgi:hypothetical protein